jgi:RNA polymerase sigma-70 factor (ECF subfamily)
MRRIGSGPATDRELADRLLDHGEESAFRELYRRHTPRLYQFVLRLLGGIETDAEDVVQETWIRAADRLRDFRWESAFSTWLIGIGVNRCRDRIRRRNRAAEVPADSAPPAVTPARRHEERVDLERAIALLPAGYREVLLLHDVEGFTHGEIGQRLGIAEGTSKSQLFFARRAMRSLLSPEGDGENGRTHS